MKAESLGKKKPPEKHIMFIFNSFFAFGNVTMLSVSMFRQDQRKEGWRRGAQGERVKKEKEIEKTTLYKHLWFVLILLLSSIEKEEGGWGGMLRPPSCGISC